jgi:SOS-response transcriptional repressor LexA
MATPSEKSATLTAIRSYVDDLYDGNVKAAARTLQPYGIKYETFITWYKGDKCPKLASVEKIFEVLKDSGRILSIGPSKAHMEVVESYDFIPRVVAVAGAGESLQTEGAFKSLYAFRKEFLAREGIEAKSAVMMYVSGDSMEPTIMDRDTILIDKRDNVPKDGYIYAVTLGDALMVKRMQKIIDGWILKSDNPKYAPVTVQGQEQEKMVVHGRVRWFSRVI